MTGACSRDVAPPFEFQNKGAMQAGHNRALRLGRKIVHQLLGDFAYVVFFTSLYFKYKQHLQTNTTCPTILDEYSMYYMK